MSHSSPRPLLPLSLPLPPTTFPAIALLTDSRNPGTFLRVVVYQTVPLLPGIIPHAHHKRCFVCLRVCVCVCVLDEDVSWRKGIPPLIYQLHCVMPMTDKPAHQPPCTHTHTPAEGKRAAAPETGKSRKELADRQEALLFVGHPMNQLPDRSRAERQLTKATTHNLDHRKKKNKREKPAPRHDVTARPPRFHDPHPSAVGLACGVTPKPLWLPSRPLG